MRRWGRGEDELCAFINGRDGLSLSWYSHWASQSRVTMNEKSNEPSAIADLHHNLSSDGAESKWTLSTLIGSFEERAKYKQLESYCILMIMLALLAIGGYVFWQAKDIATSDTSINTAARRQEVINQYNTDTKSFTDLRDKLNAIQINLPFLSAIDGAITKVVASIQYCTVSLKTKQGDIKTLAILVAELKKILLDSSDRCMHGASTGKDGARIALLPFDDEVYSMGVAHDVLTFNPTLITALNPQDNEITMTPTWESVKKMTDDLLSLHHKLTIEDAASQRLEKMKNETEISQLTGQKDETSVADAKTVNPLQFLIQLNIVRFGTISLIGIAIGILVPLYRFSVRLSAFYQAKADALRLHEIAYEHTSFASLSSALTPPMEFGKSQSIPDYLTSLLSLAREKDDG